MQGTQRPYWLQRGVGENHNGATKDGKYSPLDQQVRKCQVQGGLPRFEENGRLSSRRKVQVQASRPEAIEDNEDNNESVRRNVSNYTKTQDSCRQIQALILQRLAQDGLQVW